MFDADGPWRLIFKHPADSLIPGRIGEPRMVAIVTLDCKIPSADRKPPCRFTTKPLYLQPRQSYFSYHSGLRK
jgi:hypothetical protein